MAAKSIHTVVFETQKTMTDNDKIELAELNIWKEGLYRQFLTGYNPLRNQPDISILENPWSLQCILMGDLNSHFLPSGAITTVGIWW